MRQERRVTTIPFAGGLVLLDAARGRLHVCNPAAAAAWTLLDAGLSRGEAAKALCEAYGLSSEAASEDIDSIIKAWGSQGLLNDGRELTRPTGPALDAAPEALDGPAPRTYELQGRRFRLAGAEPKVMDPLAAALAPYEVPADPRAETLEVRAAPGEGRLALVVDGVERLRVNDSAEMLGAVFQHLLERLYPSARWLALLHGAAVAAPPGQAILLPGAGGSGKSTLAAYLSRKGYAFLADDMIALTAPEGRVAPWPLVHSIKRGSWPVLSPSMPELGQAPVALIAQREMKLIPGPSSAWDLPPAIVTAIVFPTYDGLAPSRMERLSPLEALGQLLSDRAWLGPELSEASVTAFLDWLAPLPAFAITYRALSDAETFMEQVLG